MALAVVTAVPGGWEGPLVSGLERSRSGVTVVRRCVDVTELLTAAAAGRARAALVAPELRRLDREVLARLAASGVAVVGLTRPGDEDGAGRLRRLGVRAVLAADTAPADVVAAVTAAVAELAAGAVATAGSDADPAAALPVRDPSDLPDPADLPEDPDGSGPRDPLEEHDPLDEHDRLDRPDRPLGLAAGAPTVPGRLVAVWGPVGAPGRTTVAATLATELADPPPAADRDVLLADADTYGASLAQVLGVLDEAPGLAAACRAAAGGGLDAAALARSSRRLRPGLRLLTGISRSSRWPEVGAAALAEVWRVARASAPWTVVDCGFCLEQDEELSFDVAAPRRNAATLVTLAAADDVVAVGSADPVGLQRLVRGLQDLRDTVPGAAPRVVLTRVRASAVGGAPRRRLLDALARYAGVHEAVLVPDDRSACDAALLAGRALGEHAPSSPARLALAGLAADLAGRPAPAAGRRRSVLGSR